MRMTEYLDKQELQDHICENICRWCSNYKSGKFTNNCAICKVSLVFSTIALSTPHYFKDGSEIHIELGDTEK